MVSRLIDVSSSNSGLALAEKSCRLFIFFIVIDIEFITTSIKLCLKKNKNVFEVGYVSSACCVRVNRGGSPGWQYDPSRFQKGH